MARKFLKKPLLRSLITSTILSEILAIAIVIFAIFPEQPPQGLADLILGIFAGLVIGLVFPNLIIFPISYLIIKKKGEWKSLGEKFCNLKHKNGSISKNYSSDKLSIGNENSSYELKKISSSKRVLNILFGIPLILFGLIGYLVGIIFAITIIGLLPAFFIFAGATVLMLGGGHLLASKYEPIKCECGNEIRVINDFKIIICSNCKKKIKLIR